MRRDAEKDLQAAEYEFPYHHLPHREFGAIRTGRVFRGGVEYLAYLEATCIRAVNSTTKSLLDVGCGDGRLLGELRRRHPELELIGIDHDERAVRLARSFVSDVEFAVLPVGALKGQFDTVTCVETIEHIPNSLEHQFIADVGSRVAAGGRLVITVPSDVRPVSAKHYRHYNVEMLRYRLDDCLPGFEILELTELVPDRPWLDSALRLLSNRRYSVDVGLLNAGIDRLHRADVGPGRRGQHVVAVLRRGTD